MKATPCDSEKACATVRLQIGYSFLGVCCSFAVLYWMAKHEIFLLNILLNFWRIRIIEDFPVSDSLSDFSIKGENEKGRGVKNHAVTEYFGNIIKK